MDANEARLHCMLENRGGGYPCLNDEDRTAIRWLMDYAIKLKDDLYQSRQQTHAAWKQNEELKVAAREASINFQRIATL